jgi:uncharacterized protein (DUF433 family)
MKMHWEKIVFSSPEVLGGTPVFKGTRVPVLSLLEHLENGISLDEFLEDFPSVLAASEQQEHGNACHSTSK